VANSRFNGLLFFFNPWQFLAIPAILAILKNPPFTLFLRVSKVLHAQRIKAGC
jgi:hypothetical protein